MSSKNKNFYKPFYKQFLKLGINTPNKQKILNFKRKKWRNFINKYKKKLKRYHKFKPQSQINYLVSLYPNKITSYKKQHKKTLMVSKTLKLLYGVESSKLLKNKIKLLPTKNRSNLEIFKLLDQQLYTILYQTKFCDSLKSAKQIITRGKIRINQKIVKYPSYTLQKGDIISVDVHCRKFIEKNIKKISFWPTPPKHIIINYKTLEIYFGDIFENNYSTNLLYHFETEKLTNDFLYK